MPAEEDPVQNKIYLFDEKHQSPGATLRRPVLIAETAWVQEIRRGDVCLLSDATGKYKPLTGIWQATEPGKRSILPRGIHMNPRFQVRVEPLSEELRMLPGCILGSVGASSGSGVISGVAAYNLLRYFATLEGGGTSQPLTNGFEQEAQTQLCGEGSTVATPAERVIDEWLSRHGLAHAYRPRLDDGVLFPGFLLTDILCNLALVTLDESFTGTAPAIISREAVPLLVLEQQQQAELEGALEASLEHLGLTIPGVDIRTMLKQGTSGQLTGHRMNATGIQPKHKKD